MKKVFDYLFSMTCCTARADVRNQIFKIGEKRACRAKIIFQVLCWIFVGWVSPFPSDVRASGQTAMVTYYYTDPEGTVLATANEQGEILTRSDRRPYGEQVMGITQSGPGFTGHVEDPDSGLIYMQARYYDPLAGRFISPDPLRPGPSLTFKFNRYVYAANNPLTYLDPSGMDDECSAACMAMRRLSDHYSGVSSSNQGGGVQSMLGGTRAGLAAMKSEVHQDVASVAQEASTVADEIPGATIAACMSGEACTVKDVVLGSLSLLPGEGQAEKVGVTTISNASRAAFKAASLADGFVVPLKHLSTAGGRYARFSASAEPIALIKEALQSDAARFLPNNRPGSFSVITDLGRVIGTKGQTSIKIVVGEDGKIWTAYPVN
ncbi:RHS repeat-associated core domain-containing protein [Luteibacter sp.]|uniref:RHS repeat domain-containing protein n=1 Tax=Luteibacter sp. TaxID=1886636 RepID=UPI0025BF6DA9|nr:RHS repeat-associated core domain-containing protein [Luteibacter sp.]